MTGGLLRSRNFRRIASVFVTCNLLSTFLIAVVQFSNDPAPHPGRFAEVDCADITSNASNYQIITNVFNTPVPPSTEKYTISLAVHLSLNRLANARILLQNWRGCASLAVLVAPSELQTAKSDFQHLLSTRSNVHVHFLVQLSSSYYPVNVLRNLALNQTWTTHALPLDVDFCILPPLLEASVLHTVANTAMLLRDNRKIAFVVMAFEQTQPVFAEDWRPLSKKQLRPYFFGNRTVRSFHESQIYLHSPDGKQYPKWFRSRMNFEVTYNYRYEPYLVLRKADDLPRYNEGFVGRYYDKQSFVLELASRGWEMIAMHNVFVIHKYHATAQNPATLDDRYYPCMLARFRNATNEAILRKRSILYSDWGKKLPDWAYDAEIIGE